MRGDAPRWAVLLAAAPLLAAAQGPAEPEDAECAAAPAEGAMFEGHDGFRHRRSGGWEVDA